MYTNKNFVRSEENKKVIRISDYYPNNCSEQEYAEVSSEVIAAYEMFRKENNNQRVWDYRHIASVGFDENLFGEMFGVIEVSAEESVTERVWLEQLLKPYGELIFKRAALYFIEGMSVRQIAEIEGVSHTAVVKSIRAVKNIVKSAIESDR